MVQYIGDADVMKLADMPDLGSGASGVQVQVLSSAPRFKNSLEALMPKGVLFNYFMRFPWISQSWILVPSFLIITFSHLKLSGVISEKIQKVSS